MKIQAFLTVLFFPLIVSSQSNSSGEQVAEPGAGFFRENRNEVRSRMPDRSVALFFSETEKIRSNDVNFDFHQDPDFYYLTGFEEADALLIIFKEPYEVDGEKINEMIFVPGRNAEYERWNGYRLGSLGAKEKLGFQFAYQNTDFADKTFRFDYFDHILYKVPDGAVCDDKSDRGDLASMLKHFRLKTDSLMNRMDKHKLTNILESLREIKKPVEIGLLKKAIEITCESQKNLMMKIDTSYTEYKAEALIEFTFRDLGAESPGFPSIVGGGKNTCTLHYVDNQADLSNGDLLVVDVGAEYRNYTADVTRTIPVNGKFNSEQQLIYNLVLKAQNAGIEKCRKGNKFWDPHDAATEIIQEGLKELGITRKPHEAKKYFMHGTSHYLGLDVHDAGTYQPLQINQVLTVEPGIYIPEGSDCDPKWWNIGVRIEDDILITNGNPEILSDCVPREINEIEALMNL